MSDPRDKNDGFEELDDENFIDYEDEETFYDEDDDEEDFEVESDRDGLNDDIPSDDDF